MSALGRAFGISMMLHEKLERDAARDAQAWAEDGHGLIRLPERSARAAARADIAVMLREIGKSRPRASADARQ